MKVIKLNGINMIKISHVWLGLNHSGTNE